MLSCVAVFFLFTAFDSGNATQEQQVQKIQDMLGERLDAFRVAKEQECKDRALGVAATRADSIMNSSTKKKTIRRTPTYTNKGSDAPPKVVAPTPPPPPPAPTTTTTAPPAAPKDVTRDVQKTATTTGKKTDAAKKAVQDAAREVQKKATTTGKRRSGN